MPVREFNVLSDNNAVIIYGASISEAQTFTPAETHRCMSIQLKIYGSTGYGPINLELQGVDGEGKPDGNAIASGSVNSNEVYSYHSTNRPWLAFSLGAGAIVTSGITYAIVVTFPGGNASYDVHWRYDSSPTYSGGSRFTSADGGSTWTEDTSVDFLFMEEDGRRLHETNQSFNNGGVSVYHEQWQAQAFTAQTSYELYAVALRLFRGNGDTPGTYSVSIRACTEYSPNIWIPTGANLATGSFYSDQLPIYSRDADWIIVPFVSSVSLTAGTMYAIVLEADPTSSSSDAVTWQHSTYNTDVLIQNSTSYSANQGVAWTNDTGGMVSRSFRCYGNWAWDQSPTMLESYKLDIPGYFPVQGASWGAQSFIADGDSEITSIKFKMYRSSTPGNITVSLQLLDANNDPDGSDIAGSVGTYNGNLLTTNSVGEWVEFLLSGVILASNTKYAIVVKAVSAGAAWVGIKQDSNTLASPPKCPTALGGYLHYSYDSGSSWGDGGNWDMVFETWGTQPPIAPVVTVQPISAVVNIGDSANLSITATGFPAPTYQWNRDGSPLAGETSSSLTFIVDANSGGDYTCVATNASGSDTSDAATLSIIPLITVQSSDTIVLTGQQVTLGVTAVGTPTLTYQWYKNGSPISGEISAILTFYGTVANAATYTCVVTNGVGSDTTTPIVVTLGSNPYIWNLFNLTLDAGRAD